MLSREDHEWSVGRLQEAEAATLRQLPWVKANMPYRQWRAWVKFFYDEPLRMDDWAAINSTRIPYRDIEASISAWFGPLAIKGLTERLAVQEQVRR